MDELIEEIMSVAMQETSHCTLEERHYILSEVSSRLAQEADVCLIAKCMVMTGEDEEL